MSIILSPNLVLTQDAATLRDLRNPIIAWKNYIAPATITATTENAAFPASNLGNPSTYHRWQATSAALNYLTHTDILREYNYVGIARHNFGTGQIPVNVQGFDGVNWNDLTSDVLLADDKPVLFQFETISLQSLRLKLQAGISTPTLAVMYAGTLLRMERKIQVSYVPLEDAVMREEVSGRSESGNYLGRVELSQKVTSPCDIAFMTPQFVTDELRPFLTARVPFFFAWSPVDFPNEVGYAWLMNDPQPTIHESVDYRRVLLEMQGIVK